MAEYPLQEFLKGAFAHKLPDVMLVREEHTLGQHGNVTLVSMTQALFVVGTLHGVI